MPKDSARRTKSGLVKSTPKCSPNFLSCFQTIEPNWRFSQMTLTNGVFRRIAVSSSWQFMRKPPSPLTVDDLALGVHELGRDRARQREAHACKAVCDQDGVRLMGREHPADPQLVQPHVGDQDVLAAERLADLPQRPRGLHREGVVVLGLLEAPEHDVAQPLRPAGVRDVAALLGQPREHVVDVADRARPRA